MIDVPPVDLAPELGLHDRAEADCARLNGLRALDIWAMAGAPSEQSGEQDASGPLQRVARTRMLDLKTGPRFASNERYDAEIIFKNNLNKL